MFAEHDFVAAIRNGQQELAAGLQVAAHRSQNGLGIRHVLENSV
jgi:hypothetical protein